MKTRNALFVLIIMLAYALPFMGNLTLLYIIQLALLVLLGKILLTPQLAVNSTETILIGSREKISLVLILGACLFIQVLAIVEWAYIKKQHLILFGFIVRLMLRM